MTYFKALQNNKHKLCNE